MEEEISEEITKIYLWNTNTKVSKKVNKINLKKIFILNTRQKRLLSLVETF